MAKKWSDVAASTAFQALSLEEQEEARNQYFESIIAPQVPEEDIGLARSQFFADVVRRRDAVTNPFNDKAQVASKSAPDLTIGDPMGSDLGAAIMADRPASKQGIVGRISDALKPAPKSVMDSATSNVDARLKAGAGPISQETFDQAALVRGGKLKSDSPVVNRAAKGVRTFEELLDVAKDPTNQQAATEKKAQEFRTVGEWTVDTLSNLSQGAVGLVQLPINIIAPSSEVAGILRQTQKELQAAESDVSKASRAVFQDRVLREEGFFDKYIATVQELVTNPTLSISEAAKQVPNFLGIVAAARLTGAAAAGSVAAASRFSPALAVGEAITGGAVQQAARVAGTTVGGAGASMVMAGGDAAGSVYEKLTNPSETPVSVWKDNPDYQKLIAAGKTPKQAIEELATTKARMAAAITAPLGLLGYAGAEAAVATKGLGQVTADMLTPRGMGKTAVKDIVGEQLEEGGTQGGANVIARTIDPTQNLLQGVPEAMGTALVTSAPFTAAGLRSQYKEGMAALENRDPAAERVATALLDTRNPNLVSPNQTRRQADDVGPSAPPRITNFTPADSPSAQAGLAPIVVPESSEVIDVSRTSVPGAGAGDGSVAGSDQPGGGVGVPGLGLGLAGLERSGDAGLPAADAGEDVLAGDRGGEQPAGLDRLPQVAERATDQDLLARVQSALSPSENNNANIQPAEQWFGRRGDGYSTDGDAQQALPGRQRMFPDLSWRIEAMPNGKFRLAGYTTGATDGRTSTATGTSAGLDQQAGQRSQSAPATATVQNLVNEGTPSLPNVGFSRSGSAVDVGQVRAEYQQRLDTLRQNGDIDKDIQLGTPEADVERGVQELGAALNDQFGASAKIIPYADMADDAVNGFELDGNVFINAQNLDVSAPRTTLHEFKHVIERIALAEAAMGMKDTAAQQFVADIDSIFDDMTEAGKRAYLENFLYQEELDRLSGPLRERRIQQLLQSSKLRSEMTADFLGNRAQDRQFLAELAAADPQGFKGFVERWIKMIDNLIAKLRGSDTQGKKESAKVDQYVRDLNKAKMIARDALIAYRKGALSQQTSPNTNNDGSTPSFSNREKVGDFDVRTMKDGTMVVYGDPQSIRSQIPEDVKGRVTKDGIVFTTSAAPRVKAALGGRTTAYSREGAVLDKLPIKNGKYVGAPEKFNTPGKIPTLRKWLRQLALEGEAGRYWYENSGREVLKMVGGDMQEARRFVALLAIYSPQAKVDANSTFALRAWAQYKAGQPIKVKTGVQDKKAREAMADVDAFWKGEKTGNFFFNLLREIDPSTAGKQGATIDMWMMRAGQYDTDAPTATQYAFMENETNRLAAELGWEPQQVQAAIWVAMKARMENPGVKKRTEASSEKKGWIHYEYPLKNGRPVKTRKIDNEKAHRDNWLKHSFAHDPTKDDTAQAKFDFGDGLKRHIGQISFEARPGRTTGVLPGIHTAPYAQQVEFQQAVQAAFLDENGNDTLAQMLGLLVDTTDILAPGVWQGEISPSSQKLIAMAPAAGKDGKSNVDPAQAEALNIYAAISGLVARQEGVGWHRPFYAAAKRDANGIEINVGRPLNPLEAVDLEKAVGQWMQNNGKDNWQDKLAFISSPKGIRVVNFGIITNAELQQDILRVAETVLPDAQAEWFASSGDMPTNDWKEFPNGQNYVARASAAGRSDVLEWARAVLAPRVQRVFDEYADKYGWGNPGEIKFSQRQSGDGSRRQGPGQDAAGTLEASERAAAQEALSPTDPLPGAPQVQGFTGPDPRLVAVAEQYARDNGMTLRRQAEYVAVDPERARRIAAEYEAMPHAPSDPQVKEAYENLVRQTTAQYRALERAGYRFWFVDMDRADNRDYLSTPWNAMRDIRATQTMGVYPTSDGFGNTDAPQDNVMLRDTGIRWPVGSADSKRTAPVLANDLFRAVHDAFGHGLEGAGFREQGEENAWQAHRRLFTGSAVAAITSETRGQNSWLNYGPYGETNRTANIEDTVFAEQKTGLMPEWTWNEGVAGDMPSFSIRQPNTQPFYSQLERVVEAVPDRLATQPATQWKLWLDSNAAKLGVKKDEIEWTGVRDYLDLRGKDKVSKADIVDYLGNNGVQVEEVMKSEAKDDRVFYLEQTREGNWVVTDEVGDQYGEYPNANQASARRQELEDNRGQSTKYDSYTLPGGENYRELLLTLPESEHPMAKELRALGITKPLMDVSWRDVVEAGGSEALADRWADTFDGTSFGENYKSGHWQEKNILAHIRFNDRTDAAGNKVLFIEELQSDWAQDGRKKGFKGSKKFTVQRSTEGRDADLERWEVVGPDGIETGFRSEAAARRWAESEEQGQGVPTAPFVTDTKAWLSLGIKRMITYAVDNGYDKVAFVTGEQSADRYSLSKKISRIKVNHSRAERGTVNLDAYNLNGDRVIAKNDINASDLDDYIGKEMADRARQQLIDYGNSDLRGIDLKVGGEGMKSFYDKIVPQVTADVLKKIGGGKMETVQFGEGVEYEVRADNGQTLRFDTEQEATDWLDRNNETGAIEPFSTDTLVQPGFTITEAMSEKVGAEGLPMFSERQRGINVRNDGDNRYADLIVDGEKTMESRETDSLRPYVGKTVGIIRTGEGDAKLIGSVKIGEPIEVNRREFRNLEDQHLVPVGSAFDIKPGATKFLYPLTEARRFDTEREVESRGIVAREVQFSNRQQPIQGQTFYLNGESRTAQKRRFLQDYFLRVKQVQDALAEQGGVVGEAQDVYMAESLYYGRLQEQLQDFKDDVVKPLLAKVRAADLELSDLALYAYAMHAKERNRAMSAINARLNSDQGSGMTDQEADDIINAFTKNGNLQDLQDLHKDLMAITSSTRQVLLSEGLITQDEYDAMDNQFAYYVPLRGFVEDEQDLVSGQRVGGSRISAGKGFNVRGKETVRALGRTSRAGHIIENIISDYERAIGRAERNNVAKVLLDLVTTNPDPKLWEIDARRTAVSMNRQTGTVQYNNLIDKGEDTVSVKIDGREVYIKINDPLLVRAMRLAAKDESGEVTRFLVGTIGWYGNLMRNTLTRFNPAFGVVNAFKDFGFASTSMLADLGPKGMALFWKNYANPIQSGPIYDEFRAAGATTGGWHMRSAKELQKELRNLMDWEGGSGLRAGSYKAAKGLLNTLEFVGQYSETQARLAAYKAAREIGLSAARAASIAKEVSTNFNRKGEWGSAMNTAYVFFNAGVQGSAKTLKNLKSPYVMGAMAGLTGLSTALAFMAAGVGGDDEDGQAYWDKIPDEIKQRNIIIMLPPGDPLIGTGYARVGSRGRYIKLPIQYGLNVFSTMGYQIADVMRHQEDPKRGKTVGDAAINMTSVVFGAFNPIGGAFDPTKPVEVGLAAAPSIVDVAIQFLVGVDAFGKPTAPAKSPFDQRPDSENYTPALAGSWEQRLAQWLNSATGGDAAVAGKIDLAPGTIRNVVRNATGGAGDFLSSVFINIPSKMMDPVADIQAKDIPVLKAFYGEADESTDLSEYYKRRADVMKAAEEAGRRAKLGIRFDYDEENVGLQSLGKAAKVYTDLMSELRKREIEVGSDTSLPKDQQTQMRKDLQRERVAVARDFNALFMQMKADVQAKKFLGKEVLEYEPSAAVQEKAEDYKVERRQKLEDNKARAAGEY